MSDYAQDVFYYGGQTYVAGDPIEPKDAADRKSLEDRKLIGKDKPAPIKARTAAEERKVKDVSEENKAKARP